MLTLDSVVAAGGLNLSVGQRQLVAMARALLRGNNLIIMDEVSSVVRCSCRFHSLKLCFLKQATASVDMVN